MNSKSWGSLKSSSDRWRRWEFLQTETQEKIITAEGKKIIFLHPHTVLFIVKKVSNAMTVYAM